MLIKNPNSQKSSKFWSKIEILIKNPNSQKSSNICQIFPEKSNCGQKIEIVINNRTCEKTSNFGPKSKL